MRLRTVSWSLLCVFLVTSLTVAQRKRKPKPVDPLTQITTRRGDIESYLDPIPEDEMLFTQNDYENMQHKGWRVIVKSGQDAQGIQSIMYYDKSRLTKTGTIVQAWLKTEEYDTGIEQAKGHALNLEEYDCALKRHRLLSINEYDANGSVVRTPKAKKEWDYIVPDSIGEEALLVLCGKHRDQEEFDFIVARNWFGDARRYEKAGNYKEALFWYQMALKHSPSNEKIINAVDRMNLFLPTKKAATLP